ncbi:MAG: hypothetical protein ISS70_19485 [Phycisphaerae bacterium]|nr:hypothetical protein [Phycisphaerae bacterium]
MDSQTARDWLNDAGDRKPSELGEAIDVLYRELGNYKAIASQVRISTNRLSQLRRVFLLPEGIRWQVDEGKIQLGHVEQISRLQEDDQWLLAFTIVQGKIGVKDSTEVVHAVVAKKRPLRDVLYEMIGIRFDQVKPLLLPFTFEENFKIARAAWRKKLEWADFSLKAIEDATRVDLDHIAGELASLAHQLRPTRNSNQSKRTPLRDEINFQSDD